jgi:hypothetical protein
MVVIKLWVTWQLGRYVSETVARRLFGTSCRPLMPRAEHFRRYRNSVNALQLTVTAGVTSRHVNSSNAARFERIGEVLMLMCPIVCYTVCTGKCVSTSSRHCSLLNLKDVTSRHGVKFIGAFAIFREATIRFDTSIRPSVCPHGTIRLPRDGFL